MLLTALILVPVTLGGKAFLPADEAARVLGWSYTYDSATEIAQLQGRLIDPALPRLWNGTYLLPLDGLPPLKVRRGEKRVLVDLGRQEMQAFEGSREVIRCQVSTGRPGKETPIGRFRLGIKDPDHVSSIYKTPMPWSVHVTGAIYIHGSEWFSNSPASHGCIRLEMHGATDWAQWFYSWAESGVPIVIRG